MLARLPPADAPRRWYRCEHIYKDTTVCGKRTSKEGKICGKHHGPGWRKCNLEGCDATTISKYGYCDRHRRNYVVQVYRRNVKAIRVEDTRIKEMNAYIDSILDGISSESE